MVLGIERTGVHSENCAPEHCGKFFTVLKSLRWLKASVTWVTQLCSFFVPGTKSSRFLKLTVVHAGSNEPKPQEGWENKNTCQWKRVSVPIYLH